MDMKIFSRIDEECEFVENGIRYTKGGIRKDTVRICGFADGAERPSTLLIPAIVRGKHVIFVDNRAFMGEPIEEVIIENRNGWSLSILDSAFANCKKLHTVRLETDNMIDFEKHAFMGCENLIRVDGNNAEVRVYNNTFKDCVSLEEFQPSVVVLWREAFNNCKMLHDVAFSKPYALLHDGCFNNSAVKQISVGKAEFNGDVLRQMMHSNIAVVCSDISTLNSLKAAGVCCNAE